MRADPTDLSQSLLATSTHVHPLGEANLTRYLEARRRGAGPVGVKIFGDPGDRKAAIERRTGLGVR